RAGVGSRALSALRDLRRGPRLLGRRQTRGDRFARPVVVVVEVQDHGAERQALLAAQGAAAQRVLEAVEQALEILGPNPRRVSRQVVDALVRGAESARGAPALVV